MDAKQIAALREVFEQSFGGLPECLVRGEEGMAAYLVAPGFNGYSHAEEQNRFCDGWDGFLACYQHLAPQWQSIETAPRDGTMIILGRPVIEDCDAISVPGFWMDAVEDGIDYMGGDAGFVDVNFQQFSGGRTFGDRASQYAANQPTHWMPLPAAPDAAREKEKKTC